MTDAALVKLDRLACERRETIRSGIDGALRLLTAPDATEAQRSAWGESYLQCVHAQLRDLDDRAWAVFTTAGSTR